MEYRNGSRTVFRIGYHFVFAAKYRYKVLTGDVGLKAREPVRQTCHAFGTEILEGVAGFECAHIFVSAPPNLAPSETVRGTECRSSSKLPEDFPGFASDIGGDIFGLADIFALPPEKRPTKRSKGILNIISNREVMMWYG